MNDGHFAKPADNGENVIERIYHEDKLLADRNAGYMSVNAFLFVGYVTALALVRTPGLVLSIIQFSVIVLGIFLGIFHIAIGRRNEFAIAFMRALERAGKLKFKDSYLFEFYKEGKIMIDSDVLIASKSVNIWKGGKPRTMFNSIPWKWKFVGSANNVVGVIIPLGIVLFWVAISFTIQTGLEPIHVWKILFPINILIGLLLLVVIIAFLTVMEESWPEEPQEFSAKDTILAVLGRGIQFREGAWTPTQDIETYKLNKGIPEHSPVPLKSGTAGTVDLIGGGSANVEAASLFLSKMPMLTLTGFAPPAEYLKKWNDEDDGPSEGLVMANKIKESGTSATIMTWEQLNSNYRGDEKSNTELEVKKIIEFAKSIGFHKILFLTVSVHSKRVEFIAGKNHEITFSVISSDEIIETLGSWEHDRIKKLRESEAFKRTLNYEKKGIRKLKRKLRKNQ